MIKSELVQRVVDKNEALSLREVETVVTAITDEIADAMARGDRVEIRGFGTFSVRDRKARIARNPRTGEEVKVAAKKAPHFKPGKQLKDLINS